MVLNDLARQLTSALSRLSGATSTDDGVLEGVLKDITSALLAADVNVKLVGQLNAKVKAELAKIPATATGVNRARVVESHAISELKRMLNPGALPYKPVRGRTNVVLFVGLQGAGKTTTVAKYAHYYASRKWKVAMVCADTFRAGAFDQLKQNATKVRVPFYGSYTEADAAVIAREGVENFRAEGYEIIIVDTSGRHKQEAGLFDEMRSILASVVPNEVVFVMDGSIGQAALGQAQAFKATVPIGSVIITKLDGHAKGGGALSAVAATASPIVFIGTGEGFDDLALFDADRFVGKLLGKGDFGALASEFKDKGIAKQCDEVMDRFDKTGKFTFRDSRDQFMGLLQMGSVGHIADMLPAPLQAMIGSNPEESTRRIRKWLVMINSMTVAELECAVEIEQSRAYRIIRGSGCAPMEFEQMMGMHKNMEKMMGSFNSTPLLKNEEQLRKELKRDPNAVRQHLLQNVDPKLIEQVGGVENLMLMLQDPDMMKMSTEVAKEKKQEEKKKKGKGKN